MKLFAWGANSHGQLGLGFASEMVNSPMEVNFSFSDLITVEINIEYMTGGGGHILMLDFKGNVYAAGWNNKGQLGLNNLQDCHTITKIDSIYFRKRKIIKIYCGWDTSAAITETGEVYMWGSNLFNQLGLLLNEEKYLSKPKLLILPRKEKAIDISFGLRHSCILTENNNILLFGKSKCIESIKCNSILQNSVSQDDLFITLTIKKTIRNLVCGQNHLLFSNEDNEIIALGDNKFGQCLETGQIKMHEKIKQLKSGWTFSGCLSETGELYLWGRNNYGQLGIVPKNIESSIKIPHKLEFPDLVDQLYLGSEHGLVVLNNQNVFTWGWNEHGNCGNSNTNNVYKPEKIDLPGKCILAGTGAGFCYALVKTL